MDIRDFSAGTTLYVPVFVPGALLWSGDSHAGQGNGEVNLTAIETAYKELNITVEVVKASRSIPAHRDREVVGQHGLRRGSQQGLGSGQGADPQADRRAAQCSAAQAEALMLKQSDCRVSQVVNIKKGIHCLTPKAVGDSEDMERPTKETPKYYVSHVKDADLNKAMNDASMGMIKFLESDKNRPA